MKESDKQVLLYLGLILAASGFGIGFLVMDLAFDYNAWRYSDSDEILYRTFSYYLVILNKRLIATMTFTVIAIANGLSFLMWRKHRIVQNGVKLESDLSVRFRNILYCYFAATGVYLSCVLPRYLTFMGHPDLKFSPDVVSDWGVVLLARIAILSLSAYAVLLCLKLIVWTVDHVT